MKHYISEATGAVWAKEGEDYFTAPLYRDNTFDTEEMSLVEVWDELTPEELKNIKEALD